MPKKAACPNENIPAYPPMMFQATPIMANRNTMIMTCSGNEPLTNKGYSMRRISTQREHGDLSPREGPHAHHPKRPCGRIQTVIR